MKTKALHSITPLPAYMCWVDQLIDIFEVEIDYTINKNYYDQEIDVNVAFLNDICIINKSISIISMECVRKTVPIFEHASYTKK